MSELREKALEIVRSLCRICGFIIMLSMFFEQDWMRSTRVWNLLAILLWSAVVADGALITAYRKRLGKEA